LKKASRGTSSSRTGVPSAARKPMSPPSMLWPSRYAAVANSVEMPGSMSAP
jgi:hypothetical protein